VQGTAPGGAVAPSRPGGGEKLTFAIADDIKSLDPALAFDTWSTAVVHACTRRLVDYDATGKLIPDLAEKWEEKDGAFVFHLREGIKFADGTPIEAKHFKAAIDRVVSKDTQSPGASFYTNIGQVTALSPKLLVLELKAPEPTLLNCLGMTFAAPILPGAKVEPPPSSGPYSVEEYTKGEKVVLRRNESDPTTAGWVDRIEIQCGVAESLQLTRFESGEVDLLPAIPAAEYAKVVGDASLRQRVVQAPVSLTWYFGMNTTRKPFDNPKVREAASLAIDRSTHAQISSSGQAANGILPPQVPGYQASRSLPPQNLAEAKRLMAEAGYPNGLPANVRPVLWLSDNEAYQRHAEAIQNDLREVGIPVELRPAKQSEYLKAYRTVADCWYGGWYPDFPDAGNFFEPVFHSKNIPPAGSNAAHVRNAAFDSILNRAHGTPLGADRERLYGTAEDLLLKVHAWVPLYFEVETRYFREGVSGVTVHPVWRQILTGIRKAGGS
jgi:ABC-type transport system substrate-binding protein